MIGIEISHVMENNNQHIEDNGKGSGSGFASHQPNNSIELRNEEINAILGRVPNALIRNGIMVVFACILLVITGTIFFSYPDVISCRVMITSTNPPVHIVAQTSGYVNQLMVNNQQTVETGEFLAILDNPANTDDLLELHHIVDSLKSSIDIDFRNLVLFPSLELGDITPYYLDFQKTVYEYISFEKLQYHTQKEIAIKHQIQLTETYQNRLKEQLELIKQELSVEQRNYFRDTASFHIKAISPLELDQSKSRLVQKEHAYIGAVISLENSEMQLNQLRITLLELHAEQFIQQQQHVNNISLALDALHNQISFWKKHYTFRSPTDGVVSFSNVWVSNQFIREGEIVMTIVPIKEDEIVGKLEIPLAGSGKIKLGQQVVVKLDNYPYMEFGVIKGNIKSISLVPVNDYYAAEIVLPDGLLSNYGGIIPFSQEIGGIAEIIIEDLSLFERLLHPVRSAIKRQ